MVVTAGAPQGESEDGFTEIIDKIFKGEVKVVVARTEAACSGEVPRGNNLTEVILGICRGE